MNTYEFEVVLKVKVEAFSETDAKEMLEDNFGQGDDCGVTIESTEYHSAG
jgi:hypothetical protein